MTRSLCFGNPKVCQYNIYKLNIMWSLWTNFVNYFTLPPLAKRKKKRKKKKSISEEDDNEVKPDLEDEINAEEDKKVIAKAGHTEDLGEKCKLSLLLHFILYLFITFPMKLE